MDVHSKITLYVQWCSSLYLPDTLAKVKRRYIFMDKVKTKIIGTDYFKFFKVFIPLSVIFMTAGAAMGNWLCLSILWKPLSSSWHTAVSAF